MAPNAIRVSTPFWVAAEVDKAGSNLPFMRRRAGVSQAVSGEYQLERTCNSALSAI
jgi:hypothetical protein